jgi:hypothetical protein
VLLWVASFVGGCAEPLEVPKGAVRAEPGTLVFHPDTDQIRVEVHNYGGQPVQVSRFRIEGPDWDAFTIVEPLDPTRIDPGQRLAFTVKVDPSRFFGPDSKIDSIVEKVDLDARPFEEEQEEEARRCCATTWAPKPSRCRSSSTIRRGGSKSSSRSSRCT